MSANDTPSVIHNFSFSGTQIIPRGFGSNWIEPENMDRYRSHLYEELTWLWLRFLKARGYTELRTGGFAGFKKLKDRWNPKWGYRFLNGWSSPFKVSRKKRLKD